MYYICILQQQKAQKTKQNPEEEGEEEEIKNVLT